MLLVYTYRPCRQYDSTQCITNICVRRNNPRLHKQVAYSHLKNEFFMTGPKIKNYQRDGRRNVGRPIRRWEDSLWEGRD
jgi:hypothetical protein